MEILNWGSDRYLLAAFGHHNIEEFKAKCREEYSSFMYCLDNPIYPAKCENTYYKEVDDVPDGYINYYEPCEKDDEGALEITVWYE